jgi:ABC-type transporter Mla MlaB component
MSEARRTPGAEAPAPGAPGSPVHPNPETPMTPTPTGTDGSPAAPLRLDGEMTVFRAAEIKQLLAERPDAVELDLAGITEFDTAGVQLLLMQRRIAARRGAALRLRAAGEAVRELLALYGLQGQFEFVAEETCA